MSYRELRLVLLRKMSLVSASLAVVLLPSWAKAPAEESKPIENLVVYIDSRLGDGSEFVGSGIIFGSGPGRLYIVTANHNVRRGADAAQDVRLQFKWLPGESFKALLLDSFDNDLDLAVLSVTGVEAGSILEFDLLGSSASLVRGDPVYCLGHPNGNRWAMNTKGDELTRKDASKIYFQSSFVNPGVSGGALLNGNRELIGMLRRDDNPYGEAISIEKILEWLGQFTYPIQLSRTGAPSDLLVLERQIRDDVLYDCVRLAGWPNQDLTIGNDVIRDLAGPLKRVEENPRANHPTNAMPPAYRATVGSLYRCTGGAHLLVAGDDIPTKIGAAIPYLERSLEFDPSQPVLKENVATLKSMLQNKGGNARELFTATLQVLRGANDPEIPQLVEKMFGVVTGSEWQAERWLLNETTVPSIHDFLEFTQLRIKKEKNLDLTIDVTSKTLPNGLIQVQAKLGPNVFLWDVDYAAKTWTAKNELTQDIMTKILKPKP
jgi:hypothetical protein